MGKEKLLNNIVDAILEADIDEVVDAIDAALNESVTPTDILSDGITVAMNKVGELWAAKEFYLPDVMAAADTTRVGAEHLKEKLGVDNNTSIGSVVIGTVKGDVHNVGKNLVATFLSATGFDVHDLGEDVPAENFIEAAKERHPDIIVMSCFATNVTPVMKAITDGLAENGLRESTYCMIGGIAMNEEWVPKVGADIYTRDAYEASEAARAYMNKKAAG